MWKEFCGLKNVEKVEKSGVKLFSIPLFSGKKKKIVEKSPVFDHFLFPLFFSFSHKKSQTEVRLP